MRKFQYFIFDLDGTLAYTLPDLHNGMNAMLHSFGLPSVSLKQALEGINNGGKSFCISCLPEERRNDPDFVEPCYQKYMSCYRAVCCKQVEAYVGVYDGIMALKQKGAIMSVFSNKEDTMTKQIINKLFPSGTFFDIMGYNGRYPHKPSPEGALALAEAMGASPDDIALVGDSNVDMTLAANAGMHPIGVNWGYRPASLLLSMGAETILRSEKDIAALC